jgi:hypothetical protein
MGKRGEPFNKRERERARLEKAARKRTRRQSRPGSETLSLSSPVESGPQPSVLSEASDPGRPPPPRR